MQRDHLERDHVSVIRNREVFLEFRGQVSTRYMADRLESKMAIRITEVSLIWRPVLKRFHCNHCAASCELTENWLEAQRSSMQTSPR